MYSNTFAVLLQVTAKFGKTQQVVHHPVTFKSSAAFVALQQLRAYSSTNIYFQFKTLQPSGLIMYNAGKGWCLCFIFTSADNDLFYFLKASKEI